MDPVLAYDLDGNAMPVCDWCHTRHVVQYMCNAKYYSNHPEEDPDFKFHKRPVDSSVDNSVDKEAAVDSAVDTKAVDAAERRRAYKREWMAKQRAKDGQVDS